MKKRASRTKAAGNTTRPGRAKRPAVGARARREIEERLAEARAQLAATSEVVQIIAGSRDDVQPVFDMMADRAMQLCGALHGGVLTFDGEVIHLRSFVQASPAFAEALRRAYPRPPNRQTAAGRAILTRAVVHIPDIERDPEYQFTEAARSAGLRSTLAVPTRIAGA